MINCFTPGSVLKEYNPIHHRNKPFILSYVEMRLSIFCITFIWHLDIKVFICGQKMVYQGNIIKCKNGQRQGIYKMP